MLHLLIDTSVWLDLAERRDGQRWIVPLRVLLFQKKLKLMVPALVIDEFDRNRPRREDALTKSVVDRLRQFRRDLRSFAGERDEWGLLDQLQQHVPLVNTTAPQNFREIAELLRAGTTLVPTGREHSNVVQRGLSKKAPFSSGKNSVADAMLIELYATQLRQAGPGDVYCFVTSNHNDFSVPNGDYRQPHPDLAGLFSDDRSQYGYRVEGLNEILTTHLGDAFVEEQDEVDALAGYEEPRTLAEIAAAEQEFFDRVLVCAQSGALRPRGRELHGTRSEVRPRHAAGAHRRGARPSLAIRFHQRQALSAAVGTGERMGLPRYLTEAPPSCGALHHSAAECNRRLQQAEEQIRCCP